MYLKTSTQSLLNRSTLKSIFRASQDFPRNLHLNQNIWKRVHIQMLVCCWNVTFCGKVCGILRRELSDCWENWTPNRFQQTRVTGKSKVEKEQKSPKHFWKSRDLTKPWDVDLSASFFFYHALHQFRSWHLTLLNTLCTKISWSSEIELTF